MIDDIWTSQIICNILVYNVVIIDTYTYHVEAINTLSEK